MEYDINYVIDSSFLFDDLYEHVDLRNKIMTLKKIKNNDEVKSEIKIIKSLLKESNLPFKVKQHIESRLEFFKNIIVRV